MQYLFVSVAIACGIVLPFYIAECVSVDRLTPEEAFSMIQKEGHVVTGSLQNPLGREQPGLKIGRYEYEYENNTYCLLLFQENPLPMTITLYFLKKPYLTDPSPEAAVIKAKSKPWLKIVLVLTCLIYFIFVTSSQ